MQRLRQNYPKVRLHTLEEWLCEEGRHKRARHVRALQEQLFTWKMVGGEGGSHGMA